METEILKALPQAGVMGILAAVLFWFYREDRKKSEEALTTLGKDFRQTVEANTKAISVLCEVVRIAAPCPFKEQAEEFIRAQSEKEESHTRRSHFSK